MARRRTTPSRCALRRIVMFLNLRRRANRLAPTITSRIRTTRKRYRSLRPTMARARYRSRITMRTSKYRSRRITMRMSRSCSNIQPLRRRIPTPRTIGLCRSRSPRMLRIRARQSAPLRQRSSRQGRQTILLLVRLRQRTTLRLVRRRKRSGLWKLSIRRRKLSIRRRLLLSRALLIRRRPKKRNVLTNGQERTPLSLGTAAGFSFSGACYGVALRKLNSCGPREIAESRPPENVPFTHTPNPLYVTRVTALLVHPSQPDASSRSIVRSINSWVHHRPHLAGLGDIDTGKQQKILLRRLPPFLQIHRPPAKA